MHSESGIKSNSRCSRGAGPSVLGGGSKPGGLLARVAWAVLVTITLASLFAASGALAAADAEHTDGKDSLGEIGKKLANPTSNVWALFTEFDFAFFGGTDTGGSGNRTSQAMIFQPVMPIQITDRFRMITRPTLPIIMNQDVPQGTPPGSAGFNNFGGLGDFILPLLFTQGDPLFKLGSGGVVGGLGPAFVFPTSTSDEFGRQQYQVGLAGLALWKNSHFTIGVFPQWWWHVGTRKSSKNVSTAPKANNGNLLYFFFYELGNAWQIGFNPVMTFDSAAKKGNRANVPVGMTLAKTTKIGGRPVKFQFGVEYSVVSQDMYGKRAMFKLNIIPVVPPPLKKPLLKF